jgi:hypothetical protein
VSAGPLDNSEVVCGSQDLGKQVSDALPSEGKSLLLRAELSPLSAESCILSLTPGLSLVMIDIARELQRSINVQD